MSDIKDYFNSFARQYGLTDENNMITVFRMEGEEFQSTTPVFSPDEKSGDIKILYPKLYGGVYTYDDGSKNNPHKWFYRKRLREPKTDKNGNKQKYTQPKGSRMNPFFTPGVIRKYRDKTEIPVLYMVEGEKKAFMGHLRGLDIVGLPSINGYIREKDDDHLHEDLAELIVGCRVRSVVLLFDADTLTLKWEQGKDLTKRPNSFYEAVNRFRKGCDTIMNLPDSRLKRTYFMHIRTEFNKHEKGLDDLLLAYIPEEPIIGDLQLLHTAEKYFKGFDLSDGNLNRLRKYFGLGTVNQFYDVYHEYIGNNEFNFKGVDYVCVGRTLNDDGETYSYQLEKVKGTKFQHVEYKEHGMWIWGTKNWICVAENFQIFPKYVTEDENEEKTWILEVVIKNRENPLYVEITHEEFCSATKLKNKLAGYRLALKITDAYLGELWQHLFSMHFPLAIKISRLGYHAPSGVYFFSNKALSKTGELLTPDDFNIVMEGKGTEAICLCMPTIKKKKEHIFKLNDGGTMDFNTFFSHLSKVHKRENSFVPACFYLMACFRDIVLQKSSASPILFLKGGASSGKSSLIRSLCRLFNIYEAAANLKSKNTEAGLVRVMSHFSNGLTWMEEYHNEMGEGTEGLLQAAYDNSGYIRAAENTSNGTDSVDIYSALAVTSNFLPEEEPFFTRCVLIPISEQQKSDSQIAAYAEFEELQKGGLSQITLEILKHRDLIEKGFSQAYDTLYKHLKYAVRHEPQVVERLISNMARVLTVAYLLRVFNHVNLEIEVDDEDDILDEFIAIGSRQILRQHSILKEKTALSEFFTILQHVYESGLIHEGIHFRFSGTEIWLRFPELYTIYAQKFRQTFFRAPAERDTLRDELLAFEQPADPDKFFKTIRFVPGDTAPDLGYTKMVSGSCSMDYAKLKERYGIDLQGPRMFKGNL